MEWVLGHSHTIEGIIISGLFLLVCVLILTLPKGKGD